MAVAVHQDGQVEPAYEVFEVLVALSIAMYDEESSAVDLEEGVRGHYRGVEDKLVHVCIAVSPGDHDRYGQAVDLPGEARCIVPVGKGVPRAVVKDVACVEDHLDVPERPFHHFTEALDRPVGIAYKTDFHTFVRPALSASARSALHDQGRAAPDLRSVSLRLLQLGYEPFRVVDADDKRPLMLQVRRGPLDIRPGHLFRGEVLVPDIGEGRAREYQVEAVVQ